MFRRVVVGVNANCKLGFFECGVECGDDEAEDGAVDPSACSHAEWHGIWGEVIVIGHSAALRWLANQFFRDSPTIRNLARWRKSGAPHRWVWERHGERGQPAWLPLLNELRGEF